jgi:hypothetical protein
MLIKDVLLRDPSRYDLVNNGQARIQNESADEKMLAQLRGELSSFVCEGQYADGMARILESFLKGRTQTSQQAAWVSGFFGSGKSHLLKMLCHLWQDTEFSDGATARSLVPDLPQDVRSALRELDIAGRKSGGLLAAAGTLPAGTTENVRLSVLGILLRAVQLPDQYPQAQFQLWLEEHGYIDNVRAAVEAVGKDWQRELNSLYVSPIIAKALMSCDKHFASSEAEARETLRKQFPPRSTDLTSDEFLTMFQRVLRRYGNGKLPCTILILDEVQQYIGDSETRSVLITDIAEVLAKQLDSQVMLVGAGQSALSQVRHLNKLMDRFLIRVQLSDTDVETVTRKVLLQKQPASRAAVQKLLDQNAGEISRQLQGTKIAQRTDDQAIAVDDYPLLPVRRRFWENCFRQVDTAGTRSQLRSQLWIIHDSVAKLANKPLGAIVPADDLYEAFAPDMVTTGALPREISERIIALGKDDSADGRLRQRICGLVFLIGQLKTEAGADTGVRATADCIADLLVDDLTADNGKLRANVAIQLDELADEAVVMRVGNEFRLQTEEGRAWDDEFRKRETKFKANAADFDEQRDQLLFAAVAESLKGVKLIQGQAKISRSLVIHRGQDAPVVSGEAIPVWIRDGFSSMEKAMTDAAIAAGMDSPIIFVFIPKRSREDLLNAMAAVHAAEQTISTKGNPALPETKQAMLSRRDLAKVKQEQLIHDIVGAGKVFRGGGSEVFAVTLDAKLKTAAEDSLVRLFPEFDKADAPAAAWESCIKRARASHEQPFQPLRYEGPIEQHPVCQQVRKTVGSGKTGTHIRKELESAPFGWSRDAIDAALIALHSGQQLIATLNGAPVERGQLDQNRIPKAEFRLEKTTISLDDRLKLRKLFQLLDIGCKANDEGAKAPDFIRGLLTLAADAGGNPPIPAHPATAFIFDIQNQIGNDQLAALRDQIDNITTSIGVWRNAKAVIAKRLPAWQVLERLSMYAAGIEGAEDARKQVEAIRTHRQLLDATDPVPALRGTLTDLTRKSLNDAHEAHEEAYAAGLAQLVGNDTWQKLTQSQQQRILGEVDLSTPVKPDTSTDIAILVALDSRNLAARKAETDAVAGRVANVLKAAAILLEPKVLPVIVDKVLLKTAEEVRQWTARQEKKLLAALEKGPVQVQ